MKHYVISEQLMQELANYITQNPSPSVPVGVAINLISKLQALQPIAQPTDQPPTKSNGAQPHAE